MKIRDINEYTVCQSCMEALVFPELLPDCEYTEAEISSMIKAMIPSDHYLIEGTEDLGFKWSTRSDCCHRTLGGNHFQIKSMTL